MASLEEIVAFIEEVYPQSDFEVEAAAPKTCRVRYPVSDADLRPGGTVSGPTMMALADHALYIATLASIGLVPLAVTTSFSINFMRKPRAGCDLVAECRLFKVGRVLTVGEVTVFSDGQDDPVAHATGTYSIPPER